jgi:PST family polysaccharide transporter
MVLAVAGFVMMFKDMGLSMATVQKAEINHGQISMLFWINVILSFGVMLVTAALAPAIAWFYSEPRLTWITLSIAGAIIFGGLTVQHQALLRRQMRFGSLAVIETVSLSVSIASGLIAAWYGAGYWALVIIYLAEAICGFIGVWVVCEWRPGLPIFHAGVRSMLAFGANLTGFNVLNYFARNADNILIGKFCGAGQLGLYSKAYGLLMLPITQITAPFTAVAVPALSCLQNEPERYRRYYYRAVSLIAFMSMPFVAMLVVLSEKIIRTVLGDQWTGAATVFQVLAFLAFLEPVTATRGWVFISLGQTRRLMYWGLVSAPIVVLSFIIGLPWGAVGVATSYTICTLLTLTIPALFFAFRYSPITLVGFFNAIWRPLFASVCAAILASITTLFCSPGTAVMQILFYATMFTFYYLFAIAVLPGGWQMLKDVRSTITNLRPKEANPCQPLESNKP